MTVPASGCAPLLAVASRRLNAGVAPPPPLRTASVPSSISARRATVLPRAGVCPACLAHLLLLTRAISLHAIRVAVGDRLHRVPPEHRSPDRVAPRAVPLPVPVGVRGMIAPCVCASSASAPPLRCPCAPTRCRSLPLPPVARLPAVLPPRRDRGPTNPWCIRSLRFAAAGAARPAAVVKTESPPPIQKVCRIGEHGHPRPNFRRQRSFRETAEKRQSDGRWPLSRRYRRHRNELAPWNRKHRQPHRRRGIGLREVSVRPALARSVRHIREA